jgi:hypothetical protein
MYVHLLAYKLSVIQHLRFLTEKKSYISFILYWNDKLQQNVLKKTEPRASAGRPQRHLLLQPKILKKLGDPIELLREKLCPRKK